MPPSFPPHLTPDQAIPAIGVWLENISDALEKQEETIKEMKEQQLKAVEEIKGQIAEIKDRTGDVQTLKRVVIGQIGFIALAALRMMLNGGKVF